MVPLQGVRRVAELLHLLQPLTHLTSLAVCGPASWTPFLLSLAMDCSSLSLHSQEENLTDREGRELLRRRLALLSYLLRSPLYDRRSKVTSDGIDSLSPGYQSTEVWDEEAKAKSGHYSHLVAGLDILVVEESPVGAPAGVSGRGHTQVSA